MDGRLDEGRLVRAAAHKGLRSAHPAPSSSGQHKPTHMGSPPVHGGRVGGTLDVTHVVNLPAGGGNPPENCRRNPRHRAHKDAVRTREAWLEMRTAECAPFRTD
ncbi:hypothetical protein GCM10027039_24470 [Terrabacter koreensis]